MRHILVRYHEVALKRGNRRYFVEQLKKNLAASLKGLGLCEIRSLSARLVLSFNRDCELDEVTYRIGGIFGVANFSPVDEAPLDLDMLKTRIWQAIRAREFTSFRVETRRGDKSFPLKSPEINREIGGFLKAQSNAKVDLEHAELTVTMEILRDRAFFGFDKFAGAGGLPVGASGRVVVLISGGIDSPVAAYRMMQRGCRVVYVHFHSRPFLDRSSQEKAKELVGLLTRHQCSARLHLVPFGEIQRQIVAMVPRPLRVVLYRRMMLRIAAALSWKERASALVTGESLGQVASQTLSNIGVIQEAVRQPVLRPLIGMDKQEIVDQARKIGTFAISSKPDQDCCQLFVPRHPATKARLQDVKKAEEGLDTENLTQLGVAERETLRFVYPDDMKQCSPATIAASDA